MGKTISKGKTFGATETVTNTKLHALVDDATITKVTDADNDTKIDLEESSDEDKIRFDTAGTERVVINSNGINFAIGKGITDIDGDTKIQLEESSDEDIIRLDIAGTETIVLGDGTNEELLKFTNAGTNHGLQITQDGVLASDKNALRIISNVAQVNAPLVFFKQDNASSTKPVLKVENDGTGIALEIANTSSGSGIFVGQTGVLTGNDRGLIVTSNAIQTTDELVEFSLLNASSDKAVVLVTNAGTGDAIKLDQSGNATAFALNNGGTKKGLFLTNTGVLDSGNMALQVFSSTEQDTGTALVDFIMNNAGSSIPLLKLGQAGSGTQIVGQGNENLSNAGVWTDRTSLFADKENLIPLVTTDLVDKLKAMKLYRYQKKCEVYGNKKDDKYSITKKRPNAKEYVGLILDEPTTPEELISRDLEGNINGKSGTQIAEFLLGVCQGLIKRIEVLETA